jgi:membrane protein implicated in regulation of membrane protease activity
MFVLENTFFLVPFAGIAVCGILGWISITHESRAKEDVSRGRFLEIAGKPGIVVQECSPEGKARIGDVTWSAISSNGTTLMVGEEITVQDMRDLKLIIKAKDSAMSVHH